MKVYIDKQVYQVLDEFYDASMRNHITLDYPTVIAKIDRLEQAMYDFAENHYEDEKAGEHWEQTFRNLNFDKKWEIIKIKEINCNNNMNVIYLEKFITFLDDYNNIIIFGGEDYNNEKCNKNIFGFNLEDNSFSTIGKIDSSALYLNQYIKLDESIFSVFDENNGLHFFSKELDYHEIFNLNL